MAMKYVPGELSGCFVSPWYSVSSEMWPTGIKCKSLFGERGFAPSEVAVSVNGALSSGCDEACLAM